jgi:hypothetical protein
MVIAVVNILVKRLVVFRQTANIKVQFVNVEVISDIALQAIPVNKGVAVLVGVVNLNASVFEK